MIILIDENKKLKDFIDEANFSKMGVWERTHMEEWIAKRPDILGEDLLTITTEYAGFDKTNKRLDILAIDRYGKLVVIELKRDVAEAFVDLQAIHYAAYCSTLTLEQVAEIKSEYSGGSKEENETEILDFITKNDDFNDFDNQPRIIIVANDFKEDTLATVLWLRDIGADITCVKLESYQLKDNKNIILSPIVIIPLPEAKQFMIYKDQKTKVLNQSQSNDYSEFWREILRGLREVNPDIPKRRPFKGTYFPIATNIKDVHFEWMIRKRPSNSFMACLHFEKKEKSDNAEMMEYFKKRKDEIQQKMHGEKIIYDENFGKREMQIYIKRDSIELNEENIKWGIEAMNKLYNTLNPILNEMMKDNSYNL